VRGNDRKKEGRLKTPPFFYTREKIKSREFWFGAGGGKPAPTNFGEKSGPS
jgi:hypothetical protein